MDLAHIITGDDFFQEDKGYKISTHLGESFMDDPLNDTALYSVIADERSSLWFALVLEKGSTNVEIFDVCHGLISIVAHAVDEHYHHAAIEVSTSILFAAVTTRKRQKYQEGGK